MRQRLGPALPSQRSGRLINVSVSQNGPSLSNIGDEVGIRYWSVFITFRLYDNPLGRAWRLRAAKADVFSVMKGLYTSRLAVYNVEMIGVFPIGRQGAREVPVIKAYLSHAQAQSIPWKRWGREDEGLFWANLSYSWVDHQFA